MIKKLRNGKVVVIEKGQNGYNYCVANSVLALPHCSLGNSKVGEHVGCYNLSIEYTCNHACECYKEGKCYACGGFYQYASNQAMYTENYLFYRVSTAKTIADFIIGYIRENKLSLFRYFTCGDIPGNKFMLVMVMVAQALPNVTFWTYTKKYHIVNKFVSENGIDSIPSNLTIIFSHWLNNDGTYFSMNNPYNFPTSEFIPVGQEQLVETVNHVCPCSDPNVIATCETCKTPCYKLTFGQSMALLEHSTKESKERDKLVKESHKALANNK